MLFAVFGSDGRAVDSPQEGHHLCPGAGRIGREGSVAGTGGDPLPHRPLYGAVVIGIAGNVPEGVSSEARPGFSHCVVHEGHDLCPGTGIIG